MSTESKEKKESAACCGPEKFKGMFEMMNKCCSSEKNTPDCFSVMEKMKSGGCCGPATEEKKKESG